MRNVAVWAMALCAGIAGCGGSAGEKAAPAATVENAVPEDQLARLHLSPEAVRRLGIETAVIDSGAIVPTRTVGGEVMAPPGRSLVIAAPTAGTVLPPDGGTLPAAGARLAKGDPVLRLLALPANQANASEAAATTAARLRQAEAEAQRVARLYADRLVSAREHEQAQADLAAARAAADAAKAQLAQVGRADVSELTGVTPLSVTAPAAGVLLAVHVAAGQAVAAGTPLVDLVSVDRLWIRVPMYAGDARAVARGQPAQVTALGGGDAAPLTATPVRGPPVADAAAASVDLYYEVRGGGLRPGERVTVAVPLAAGGPARSTVALAAVVYDAQGGTWVYERLDSLSFARRRIDIERVIGDRVVLARGPKAGTRVVTAGVAELFGTEFGTGK